MIVEHQEGGNGITIHLAPGEAFDLLQGLLHTREYMSPFYEYDKDPEVATQEAAEHQGLEDPLPPSLVSRLMYALTEKVRDYVLGSEEVQ